jgi:hypothetical protein
MPPAADPTNASGCHGQWKLVNACADLADASGDVDVICSAQQRLGPRVRDEAGMARRRGIGLSRAGADLLPVRYFYLVLTLPAEIAPIVYQNKAVVYDPLLRSAAETLITIAADLKHLGARIGATAVRSGSAATPPLPTPSPYASAPRELAREQWLSSNRLASG